MRTFLCIPVNSSLKAKLDELSQQARQRIQVSTSWVRPENFHVTVRFLGEIDPMLTIDLEQSCKAVTRDITPFNLPIDRVGAFPTPSRPRVLWAGGEAPSSFRDLLSSLDRELTTIGFPSDRPETIAHITLARIKGRPDPGIAQTIRSLADLPDWTLRADRLVLMESRLTAQGAIYTPLFTLPLGEKRTDAV
jgi:2'-5' RNA ligase